MNQLSFIPLHIHSDFSIVDGLESVEKIVKRAKELGYCSLALTDMCNVSGFIRFYNQCLSNGIKPIMGSDIYIYLDDKKSSVHKVTILAKDNIGVKNLYKIISEAWLKSDPGEFNATTSIEELAKYHEGLFLLCGFKSDIAKFIYTNQEQKAKDRILFYKKHFAQSFCFEITRTNRAEEKQFEHKAIELAQEFSIPLVASNDTCFLYGPDDVKEDGFSDHDIHHIRVCINRGVKRGDKDILKEYSPEQYLKSPEQMAQLFSSLPIAIENSHKIMESCNIHLQLDKPSLPHYNTGELSAAQCLRQKAYEGLEQRLEFLFKDKQERESKRALYTQRLETELKVIIDMDFPGYFLIVMEFIQWSKENGVPVGPGRGSGGGSLVAYALKITDFDPIRFDLLFERFLNPERVSMPDFDVDFCQRNREKTLEHVRDHYGRDAVAQIATFGTMAAKASIKDAGRALGISYSAADFIAKKLPTKPGITFKSALGIDKNGNPTQSDAPEFLSLYQQALENDDREKLDLIHIAMRLEGVIRNIGKHAAGVVISPTVTVDFSPLMLDSDGNTITQFDKKDVEHAGLVKFDFLGLTTLTIIQDAVDMINKKNIRLGKELFNVNQIPYEDEASYKVIQSSETTGVFQLESDGMRQLIASMQPDRFDDLIALVALYRPGPMGSGMVKNFVQRKQGIEKISYPSPDFEDLDLKPILDPTYGVIVYQEQVMQIAQVLAKYTLGGADILRRAMGKKNPAEMASQRDIFKNGAIALGKDPDIAMKIFDQVEKFAEYGFNKSHSAAYALLAWWTLYLKTHYPAEFLAAMMSAEKQKSDALEPYIFECNRLKLKLKAPNVQEGFFDFTVDDEGAIVYGIGAIKGIGEDLVNSIVEQRQIKPYEDFFDFAKRNCQKLNKKSLQSLICSGALDCFNINRKTLVSSIDTALKYSYQTTKSTNQGDLFDMLDIEQSGPSLSVCENWSESYTLLLERQVLGLYISKHPLANYQSEIEQLCSTNIKGITPGPVGSPNIVSFAALVIDEQERVNKSGKKYYELTVGDEYAKITLRLYNAHALEYEKIKGLKNAPSAIKADCTEDLEYSPIILLIEAKCVLDEEDRRMFSVLSINSLENVRRNRVKSVIIKLPKATYLKDGQKINDLICQYKIDYNQMQRRKRIEQEQNNISEPIFDGCNLYLILDNTAICFENQNYKIDPCDDFICKMGQIVGFDNLLLQ